MAAFLQCAVTLEAGDLKSVFGKAENEGEKKKKRKSNYFASEHYGFFKIHILKTTPLSHNFFPKFRNGFNVIILDRMIFSIKAL